MKKLLIVALMALACAPSPVLADKAVKDASGTNFNLCTTTASTTEIPCHQVKNSSGTTIDPATAGNQSTGNTSLATIATNTTSIATAANQATTNTKLDSVITALGSPEQAGGVKQVASIYAAVSCTASPCFQTTTSTTLYSYNMLVADSATAGSVTTMTFAACRTTGGSGMIRRARVKIASDSGYALQPVILKLYKSAPTINAGDHATWNTTESEFLGSITVVLDQHFSDYEKGIGAPDKGGEINFSCAAGSQNIYGLLVAGGNITPASASAKNVTAVLEVLQN